MRSLVRWTTLMTALGILFGVAWTPLAGSGNPLSAGPAHAYQNPIVTYFEAMGVLTEQVADWQVDVEAQLSAMRTKPELACGGAYAELLRRGHGLLEDMRGTGELAPSLLDARHDAAVAGMERSLEAAQRLADACDGTQHERVTEEFRNATAEYASAVRLIRYHAARMR